MDFNSLDFEHKQALICTFNGLGIAIALLADETQIDEDLLTASIHAKASEFVDSMDKAEIVKLVAKIEQARQRTSNILIED